MKHRDFLADRQSNIHVVLDQHDRDLPIEAQEEFGQNAALVRRQPGGRLVEHDQTRLEGQREAYLELAAFAMREIARPRGEAIVEAHGARRGVDPRKNSRIGVRPIEIEMTAFGRSEHAEIQILLDGQRIEQRRGLKGAAQAERDAPMHRHACDVALSDPHRAPRRPNLASDHVEEGGLAGAVRPDDRAALALRDGHSNVAQGLEAAEPDRYPIERKSRCSRRRGRSYGHFGLSRPNGSVARKSAGLNV